MILVPEGEVRKVIDSLDKHGRWVTVYAGERLVGQPKFADSFRYISSDVFSRNLDLLTRFYAQSR
jgi:hypothetical protein